MMLWRLCFWHAGAGPAGRVLSSVLVHPTGVRATAAWKFTVNTSNVEHHVNHME